MATGERHRALRFIAAYKFLKAAGLIAVAIGAFDLIHAARFDAFTAWVLDLPIHHGHILIARLVDRLLDVTPHRFLAIGIAACVYAGVFVVEGCGLWLEKRWAEYLTTIVTASLIPLEVYEMYAHFSPLKFVAFATNVAIVTYLIYLLRQPRVAVPARAKAHE